MQERHINRDRYFEEQAQTTRKYYIPYIKANSRRPSGESLGSRMWRRR